jgi:hypothetical protein
MDHIGTITKTTKFPRREFHGECSCGTAGDFATKDEAASYLTGHGNKVVALGPVNTFELVDNSDKPEAKPAPPRTPHIGGVGTMPPAHAAPPPAPPPPPDAKAQTVEQLEADGPAKKVTPAFPAKAGK